MIDKNTRWKSQETTKPADGGFSVDYKNGILINEKENETEILRIEDDRIVEDLMSHDEPKGDE